MLDTRNNYVLSLTDTFRRVFTLIVMWKKVWLIIEKPLIAIGSICSIVSVAALCFKSYIAIVISVSALCIALVVILVAIVRVLNRFLEDKSGEDYKCVSSFIRYKTADGENIEVESYKLIQVKCSLMQFFDVGFKWTGKNFPEISSDLQTVENSLPSQDSTSYDKVRLRLKQPALYNETTVIHFRSKTNDAEKISEPKVEVCVKWPIEFIQINIHLGYKDTTCVETARIERKKINSDVPQKYEVVKSIPFDNRSRQYVYSFINPEPGYFYKIVWER